MDKLISDLGAAIPLIGTEQFEVWQGPPESVRTTLNDISTFITSSIVAGGVQRISKNITGTTSIDLAGTSGTVYVELSSSNAVETINSIINFTNVDIVYLKAKLSPSLDITYNDLGSGGNLKLWATPLTPIGSQNGMIKFFKIGSRFYQEMFIDQYV